MKKMIAMMVVLAMTVAANAASFGWEDMAVGSDGILSSFGNVESAVVTDEDSYSGLQSLKITENPLSSTPQAYIAWVQGVSAGDTISASMWIKGAGETSKGRIWGAYSAADDITSYKGSASGPGSYAGEGNVWEQHSYEWTVGDGQEAFILQARIYSYDGENNNVIYVDDVEITSSNPNAAITFVPEPATMALVGAGALALIRRRK